MSAYWDGGHPFHTAAKSEIDAIPNGEPRFVSRMTLAEIEFGILLDEVATGAKNPRAALVLSNAQQYPIREITQHTAHEYADLRKNIAAHYLDVPSKRPRWIENWKDRVTGETLQIDENDLWICAQARETNLILITTDKKLVTRISPADPSSRFRLIRKD